MNCCVVLYEKPGLIALCANNPLTVTTGRSIGRSGRYSTSYLTKTADGRTDDRPTATKTGYGSSNITASQVDAKNMTRYNRFDINANCAITP